jgi:hypothetical protein
LAKGVKNTFLHVWYSVGRVKKQNIFSKYVMLVAMLSCTGYQLCVSKTTLGTKAAFQPLVVF